VLADALAEVTGVAETYGDLPAGTRAVSLVDALVPSVALDVLGRCPRDGSCDSAGVSGGLAARLHLINGPLINQKLSSPDGRLHRLLAADHSDAEMIEEFYLRALSRLPTDLELGHWMRCLSESRLREGDDVQPAARRRELWEDLVWSLLNCREFVTNH
jgi:hypothetical protein